uniref:Fungal_trans domain-containing protein n=1 Tax=Elaeophora elaphi TaxID=1147741 RepID=A0A0R3RV75_9BILA
MDDDDQMMHPVDAELLNSEEEFDYPSDPQPSTSFFTTTENLLFNSCGYHNLHLPQAMIESALQYLLTTPLMQLAGSAASIESQLIPSEYCESLAIVSYATPELLNSLAWDQWLSSLAVSLTPTEWQLYWMNYLALFGTIGLPQHIADFFAIAATANFPSSNLLPPLQTNVNWMLFRQQFYGMHFLFFINFFSF